MSNLNVTGNITKSGQQVALQENTTSLKNYTVLYSSTSVTKGNKTISGRFSDYKMLAFGEYTNVTNGYSWYLMPRETFFALTAKYYIQQNIATADRRFQMSYVSDTQFNISYVDGANGIQIVGFN